MEVNIYQVVASLKSELLFTDFLLLVVLVADNRQSSLVFQYHRVGVYISKNKLNQLLNRPHRKDNVAYIST